MNFLRLILFHTKVYSKNSYFITLLFTTTISFTSIEYVFATIYDSELINTIWLTGAIFGFWNLCVTAAGAINFQKRQQTLIYLLNNQVSDLKSILALLIAPATFGLFAFPISYIFTLVLGLKSAPISILSIMAIIFLYLGGIILSLLIASFFILTKNAIIYEKLLVIPILIVSGLLILPNNLNDYLEPLSYLIPISAPIKFLVFNQPDFILKSIISCFTSGIFSIFMFKLLLKHAKRKSLVEVI